MPHGGASKMKEQTSATNNTATETVLTLASMSKRVVADLTNQRSIPHELASIIPHHPSLMMYSQTIPPDEDEYGFRTE
jgi:hypothetical protein